MSWKGPFHLRQYLDRSIAPDQVWPPEEGGVYLISRAAWQGQPDDAAGVLYVGGNTGVSARFRTRIGDLIADLLGFWGDETGHHSGGIRMWQYCYDNKINSLDLYLAWQDDLECPRCAEFTLYNELHPPLNRRHPNRCTKHC
jgi:hypothetical protein